MPTICDPEFYASPPTGPTDMEVVCGTDCTYFLDFRTSGGCAPDLTGALVELFVWSGFMDLCACPEEDYLLRLDNTPNGNIRNHCPEFGQFLVDFKASDICCLLSGKYCWKIKVTLPQNLITATGTASVVEGSPVVTIANGDMPDFERGIMYLGSTMVGNTGPHSVVPETVVEPLDYLKPGDECCCPEDETEEELFPLGPTGNLLANNAEFETQNNAQFAVYTPDEYFPSQMAGCFYVKECP